MLFYILLIWNLAVFVIFGLDKFFAVRSMRRISERMLVTASVLFGGFGAALGMLVFNHKTSKPKFRYLVPFLCILHVFVIIRIALYSL